MNKEKSVDIEDSLYEETIMITIPGNISEPEVEVKAEEYLDSRLVTELGVLVMQNANLFILDAENKRYYNLLCAVVDRLETAVEYLNQHSDMPKSEAELIAFMTYACMVYDAIGELKTQILFDGTKKRYHDDTKKYFKEICMNTPWDLNEEECLTDEEFFEHFRSLAFAHPYNTSHRKVLSNKYGTQYSPWVNVGSFAHPREIGVTIYSEKVSDVQLLLFDFDILKEYIKYRYFKIVGIKEWFKALIDNKNEEWRKIKITRSKNSIETLRDINRVLELRCQKFYGKIDILIDFLEYENPIEDNEIYVVGYKKAIESIIPLVCDAIDEADYEKAHDIIDSVLNVTDYNNPDLDYCVSKASDLYHKPDGFLREYKSLIEEMMKSLRLKMTIDGDKLNVVGLFFLCSAMCYFSVKKNK